MKPKTKGNSSKTPKSRDWIYLAAPVTVFVGGLLFLGYISITADTISGKENKEANLWRIAYWKTPIPFQGESPEGHHPLAKNIHAKDCGQCHPNQWKEWSESLHSETMGPGVIGQYPHFNATQVAQCDTCHAPLSEQWPQLKNASNQWSDNRQLDRELRNEGVTCAACHLRNHQRNGPPLRAGKEGLSEALHGVPNRTPFFETSEFCRGCHQHEANTLKIGGKTIENTYMEWLESPAYEEGKSCQSCHMPERRHLWKGIHDYDMTASGVTITHSVSTEIPTVGASFKATLTLSNTGTGHRFPTYTTPAVYLKAAFLDASGKVVPKFYKEIVIQRRLNMSTRPWTETFDTRIAPKESATLTFENKVPSAAAQFKLWIWVIPDQFYEGFYKTFLKNQPEHKGREQLEAALETAVSRQYALFSKTLQVIPAAP